VRILTLHAEPDASELQHRGRNKVPGSSKREAALYVQLLHKLNLCSSTFSAGNLGWNSSRGLRH